MSNLLEPPWVWPRSAYIHVPFCAHHCGYCDFAIAVNQDSLIDSYLAALKTELARLETPQRVETLFLGGGTPTHLSARQLAGMLESISNWVQCSPHAPREERAQPSITSGLSRDDESTGEPVNPQISGTHRSLPEHADFQGLRPILTRSVRTALEFSVEANPGTLDADKIAVLAEHGVNRLSLGVQSFHRDLLTTLERDHQPEDVSFALMDRIRRHIPEVSLDLIFGVPGQTVQQWQDDLRQALALEPDHIATYGLTYEKGTPLWKQRERGQVHGLDEDTELAMYTTAMDMLETAGFEHYEISNFAKPGHRCRHNQVYWANHAYFGFGMGAARYVRGVRELNTRDLATYIKRLQTGASPTFQSECLELRDRALETVAVQLRRADGIERPAFQVQTGFVLDELVAGPLGHLTELGMLVDDGVSVRLSRSGKCVADAVVSKVL